MRLEDLPDVAERYAKDGFLSPIDIISLQEAAGHRARMEAAESELGGIHYLNKIHTVLRSPYELASHPRVLEVVESLIGPDIMLHNVVYIIKEPDAAAHVSWHQDLTYWGFDGDGQVEIRRIMGVQKCAETRSLKASVAGWTIAGTKGG